MNTESKNSHQMRTHLQGEGMSKRDIIPKSIISESLSEVQRRGEQKNEVFYL